MRDCRTAQLSRLPNVRMYLGNRLDAADVRDFEADWVLIATGARWRRDGLGRHHETPIAALAGPVFTPDDVMDGARPGGRIVVFDDDHYYMGPAVALALAAAGAAIHYVTTAGRAGDWSEFTAEQTRTQRGMLEAGIEITVNEAVAGFDGESVMLACIYTGRGRRMDADGLVLVTSREPDDALHAECVGAHGEPDSPRIIRIGDCRQPSIIAAAVYAGHKAARELGATPPAFLRDRVVI